MDNARSTRRTVALPDAYPLSIRISAVDDAGWEIEHSVEPARRLGAVGVVIIDRSTGGSANHTHVATSSTVGYGVVAGRPCTCC